MHSISSQLSYLLPQQKPPIHRNHMTTLLLWMYFPHIIQVSISGSMHTFENMHHSTKVFPCFIMKQDTNAYDTLKESTSREPVRFVPS